MLHSAVSEGRLVRFSLCAAAGLLLPLPSCRRGRWPYRRPAPAFVATARPKLLMLPLFLPLLLSLPLTIMMW